MSLCITIRAAALYYRLLPLLWHSRSVDSNEKMCYFYIEPNIENVDVCFGCMLTKYGLRTGIYRVSGEVAK